MRIPLLKRADTPPGVVGTARVARRVASLLPRLRPGDIAVFDHLDLDRSTARALADAGISAAVDASPMISGRYPTLGPRLLVEAGITVVDSLGPDGLERIADGDRIRVHDGAVHAARDGRDAAPIALGRVLDHAGVETEMEAARAGLSAQLETFTHNSAEFLRREQQLLLDGVGLPALATAVADRPVIVVVGPGDPGPRLRDLRRHPSVRRPVVIAVDDRADAAREAGVRPDVVVLSADTARPPSPETLETATDVVVVAPDDRGHVRLEALARRGIAAAYVETTTDPADLALVLADHHGASLLVGVGLHLGLEDLLDRQQAGIAGGFLVRLKVGATLVTADVLLTARRRWSRWWLVAAVLVVVLAGLAGVLVTTDSGREWAMAASTWFSEVLDRARGWSP